MFVYTKLAEAALLPIGMSVLFYFLQERTPFKKVPYYVRQIVIGIVFGLAAVCGTEFGVDVGGATANARDAAPLCAGLIFGAPAGIIAGLIGGVERWFAVLWGAGMFTRVACSMATILSGFYAAFLRKKMFDDDMPAWGIGLASGIVMEVTHLTILFLTNLEEVAKAIEIVKICCIPMVFCNSLSVMFSILIISLLKGKRLAKTDKIRSLSYKFQVGLLVAVLIAYLSSTVFMFAVHTGFAENDANTLLAQNIADVKADISDASDANLLELAEAIVAKCPPDASPEMLAEFCREYDVADINFVDKNGIITNSTHPDFFGFDMSSGEQAAAFLCLLNGTQTYVQSYQPLTYDPSISRKYAGVALPDGGFAQIGFDAERFQDDIDQHISNLTQNRHVGTSGYILIADYAGNLVGNRFSGSLADAGIDLEGGKFKEDSRFQATVFGTLCYCMYENAEGYNIVAVCPKDEILRGRDMETYLNSFMEVIVFAVQFGLVFFLINKYVVHNLHSVNDSLDKITAGNLDEKINVRDIVEFDDLSTDINATVDALKGYIAAEAARMEKELTFAKSIQHAALPVVSTALTGHPEIDLHATMDTAKEVGGDFYDFYWVSPTKLAVLIADVSGKGVPAAMFMMQSKTLIKSFAETGIPINEAFVKANDALCENNEAGMFVTAWLAVIDTETGHVEYVNAGHNPPVIKRVGGSFEYLKGKAGFVLAGMDGVMYRTQSFDMNKGDVLYLYTDGVTESTDSGNQLFGEDRLLDTLNAAAGASMKGLCAAVKTALDEFVGEAPQFDDITMVSVALRNQ